LSTVIGELKKIIIHKCVVVDGSQAATQGVFMTSMSGVDNRALSSEQEADIALPLAGLPSYDDVIANSDKYASSSFRSALY